MPDPTDTDFAAVRAASERWMRAWVDQDLAALDAFLAHDFTLVIGNAPAACVPRGDWLAIIPRYVCTRFAYHDVQCRALDDLVLMSAIAEQQASVDGVDRSGRFFVTDAWRRTGDEWQVAARTSTRAEPAGEASLARMFEE
jgi:ketosteroid isomerase-like protein